LVADVVGVTDEDTWNYGEALIKMIVAKGFRGLKFVRINNIVGLVHASETTKENFFATVAESRLKLNQFAKSNQVIREMIANDGDILMKYRGYIRFLETDLRYSPITAGATSVHQYKKIVRQAAMKLLERAECLTTMIQTMHPEYVRLSIHPSSGEVKLSVPLIPQQGGQFPRTPWHCCIAVSVDGSYKTVHAKEVSGTYVLVHKNGRPYFYREKSELFDFDKEVDLEHLYPSGLKVVPRIGNEISAADIEKLKKLAKLQSPILIAGFANMPDGEIKA
jgi:pyoverdine/dityrosine biosynthesis protein Dit1